MIGAGCTTQTQIDPARKKGRKGAELFGDDERGMVGQHDTAGADTDCCCCLRDLAYHHRCRRTGDAGHVVMLGQPVARVAPYFGVARQVHGIEQRLAGVVALDNRR